MVENFRIKNECAVCPVQIWAYDGIKRKKTDEYHEATVKLNNLSNMTVGVCTKHQNLKKADLVPLTQKAQQGWLEEVALGIGKREWVESIGVNLKAVGVA